MGFTTILRKGLPRKQVQPRLEIQLLRLWEIYFYEKHEHLLADVGAVIF